MGVKYYAKWTIGHRASVGVCACPVVPRGCDGLCRDAAFCEVRASLQAIVEALRDPDHVHAICEEYRAATTLDRLHDDEDRAAERRIGCPVLALWSGIGPLSEWYVEEGGPLALWRPWAPNVEGRAMEGGHFFPEELPDETAELLSRFFEANAAI